MTPEPISIVVLQWNNSDLSERCVASIRANSDLPHELIIVDNGSDEDAASWAQDAADRVVLLENNQGFAKGMNAGLAVASHDVIAFVNNDTTLPPRWDSRLTETLSDTSWGIVAPAVTNGGNASSVRSTPGETVRRARRFLDLPSGVVYLTHTNFMRSLGGFREDYETASAEDIDLLFAVWVTGRDVAIDDRVLVDHVGSATASELPDKGRLWRQNRRQFAEIWQELDESGFRQRYDWQGEISAQRLGEARLAAYWMGRFFAEDDSHARTRAANPPTMPAVAEAPVKRRWLGR